MNDASEGLFLPPSSIARNLSGVSKRSGAFGFGLEASRFSADVWLCVPNFRRRPSNTNRLYTLGLLYLRAAAERAGWRVTLLDAYFANLSYEETVEQLLKGPAPSVVGFSVTTYEMAVTAGKLLAAARAAHPGRPIFGILGGFHASREPANLLQEMPEFDAVVRGEGEDAFEAILTAFSQGRWPEPSGSLLLRDETGVVGGRGKLHGRAELDSFGDIHFEWCDSVPAAHEWSLVTSRGCSAACSFCAIGPHWGRYREWRAHSAEWIAAQMRALADRGARYIQFVDDQFIGNEASVGRGEQLAKLLMTEPLDLLFYILARADTVINSPDVFRRLGKVGLDTVFLGIESGDDETLRKFNKEHSAKQSEAAVAILNEARIHTVAGTIVFTPWMTVETLRIEIAFLRSLMNANDLFHFYDLNELDVLSNTPLAVHHGPVGADGRAYWRPADTVMARVRDIWRLVQSTTLFPAMEGMQLLRNLPLRRALCSWQLDALERVAEATCRDEAVAAIRNALHLSMSALVLTWQGTAGLGTFIAAVETGRRYEPERCFS